jgi:hypothetical protein
MGFRALVSRRPAIQTMGRLTLTPAGLSPAEHTSLTGHTTERADFPHPTLRLASSQGPRRGPRCTRLRCGTRAAARRRPLAQGPLNMSAKV